jgi:hypothetical protein
MKVTVKPKFRALDVQRQIETELERFTKILKLELDVVALEVITEAREKGPDDGGFNDQTGNLRSSEGYIILHNGKQLFKNFEVSGRGLQGLQLGEEKAEEIASSYPKGWAIVFVAGMEYASYVEAKGRDVLTGSTLGLESKIRNAWNRAKRAA